MPSGIHRLLCLVVAFVLSGSPAVLAACTALCLDGPQAGSLEMAHAGHGAHAPEVVPDAVSHVHHHGAAVERGAQALAAPSADAGEASSYPRLNVAFDCCSEGRLSPAAGLRAERRDANLVGVAPVAMAPAADLLQTTREASPPRPPIPPDLPVRSSLVLRI